MKSVACIPPWISVTWSVFTVCRTPDLLESFKLSGKSVEQIYNDGAYLEGWAESDQTTTTPPPSTPAAPAPPLPRHRRISEAPYRINVGNFGQDKSHIQPKQLSQPMSMCTKHQNHMQGMSAKRSSKGRNPVGQRTLYTIESSNPVNSKQ